MLSLSYPEGSAFVAGGTGNVGAGVVAQLARAGLPVTFSYRSNARKAQQLTEELTAEGLRVRAVEMSSDDPASIRAALDAAETGDGPLRTFAWTVGSTVPFNAIMDFTVEEVETFLDGDLAACYRVLHQVVPRLRANGGGTITAATTIATRLAIRFDGLSPFSKGAVQALIRQIAAEEGANGIRANDVAIGVIFDLDLEQLEAFTDGASDETSQRMGQMFRQLREARRLPRSGRPVDAGNLFAFLASDQAGFITGQRVAVDGGMTL